MVGANLNALLWHSSGNTLADARAWLWGHTLYPLWGVFSERLVQKAWLAQVSVGSGRGFARFTGANIKRFSPAFSMCWDCVRDDISEFGRAYWHRSHQVLGVEVCHRHGARLLTRCPVCAVTLSARPRFRLPSGECPTCRTSLQVAGGAESNLAAQRYAQVVHSVLNCEEGTMALGLSERLRERLNARSLLQDLRAGISEYSRVAAGFPADPIDELAAVELCLSRGDRQSPMPILMIAACVDVRVLVKPIAQPLASQDSAVVAVSAADSTRSTKLRELASFGIARAFLRLKGTRTIAAQYQLSYTSVLWLRSNWPTLQERRNARRRLRSTLLASERRRTKARGLTTTQRARYRERLLSALQQEPNATRGSLGRVGSGCKGIFGLLRRFDREWLDTVLPRQERSSGAPSDNELSEIVLGEEFLSRSRFRGTNSPWSFSAKVFGTHFARDLSRGRYPKTAALLRSMGYPVR